MNIDESAMCCISMHLSRQALHINGKLSSCFKFFYEILAEN